MWYKRFAPSKNWNTGSFQCVDPVYIVLDPGSLFFYTCLSRPSLGDPFKPRGIKTLLSTRVRFKYVSPFLDPSPLSVMWNSVLRNTGPEKETFLYQCGIMFLGEKPMTQTQQITIEKISEIFKASLKKMKVQELREIIQKMSDFGKLIIERYDSRWGPTQYLIVKRPVKDNPCYIVFVRTILKKMRLKEYYYFNGHKYSMALITDSIPEVMSFCTLTSGQDGNTETLPIRVWQPE